MEKELLEKRIEAVSFRSVPVSDEGTTAVIGQLYGGGAVELFRFHEDEIGFLEEELVGLTVQKARYLKAEREHDYTDKGIRWQR